MELVPYIFTAVVGLVSGFISGVSGGGGAMLGTHRSVCSSYYLLCMFFIS